MRYIDSGGIELLCNAIVVQAAKDYRQALRTLKADPDSQSALDEKRKLERFFRSQRYEQLTKVDGGYLIRKLQEEAR